ncbi:hypothetical protein CFR75_15945 [Komagataeibacter xylinus]|uniref:Uncharacterized protein n=1 Tax=Komagataeibacter xylinus TaxID=28448 RepID=A0A318PHF5_KOMXY|nr:DUF4224 domain-containing protein [Komagataeibacter xylinus]PYD55545.1 hypothetical protein CFR75_15945 [Komagataeibacter xylinus]
MVDVTQTGKQTRKNQIQWLRHRSFFHDVRADT